MSQSSDQAADAGALAGIRVVELGGLGPSAWACTFLSDMGAEVVRVDRPGRGDIDFGSNWMRGRARLEVDVADPAGRERVLDLIRNADLVTEAFRPGVAERLGLGPDECTAVNSRLIYVRLTGWGQDGPYAARAGHDVNYIGIAGPLAVVGTKEQGPVAPLYFAGDWASGTMLMLLGAVSALFERERSGRGQVVDAAIVDGAALMLMQILALRDQHQWADRRQGNLIDGGSWAYGVYRTLDGRYMAVGGFELRFRERIRAVLGLEDEIALDDPTRWAQDHDRVARAFARRTQAEWEHLFAEVDACVTPVRELAELEGDPHLRARGTLLRVDGRLHAAPAPRFSRTPSSIRPPLDAADLVARWTRGSPARGASRVGSGATR